MKILIFGYKYFAKSLASDLQKHDLKNHYVFIDTADNIISKMKSVFEIITADRLFIIGGCINNSKVIDIALFLKKEILMEWVGTDVLNAKKSCFNGEKNDKYLYKIKHYCEIDWIEKELLKIGIVANICDIVRLENDYQIKDDNDASNTVIALSYIGKNREDFYGIENILNLAKIYTEIEFRICGTDGENIIAPPNVLFLGWIDDMRKEFKKCSIFLRLVEHDGLAFSVVEALSFKKWVIYSQSFEYTYSYNNFDELVKCFQKVMNNINNKELNKNGKKYVLKRYNKNRVLNNLVRIIQGDSSG